MERATPCLAGCSTWWRIRMTDLGALPVAIVLASADWSEVQADADVLLRVMTYEQWEAGEAAIIRLGLGKWEDGTLYLDAHGAAMAERLSKELSHIRELLADS